MKVYASDIKSSECTNSYKILYCHRNDNGPMTQLKIQFVFSVVGPSAWNDLPFELRSLLVAHPSKFYISLKSFFFAHDWAGSAAE